MSIATTRPSSIIVDEKDSTSLTIEKLRGEGQARTKDDTVIELLLGMTNILNRILIILELEFEMSTQELQDGQD